MDSRRRPWRPALLWAVSLSIFCAASAVRGEPARPSGEKVIHKMELADPVFADKPARVYSVVEVKDANGFPKEYYLAFQIHVCTDGKCRVVKLTMYWDPLGYFRRLEVPPNMPLTKKEHVPFSKQDYEKLDQILKDRASILGTYSLDFLAKPANEDQNGDAHAASGGDGADAWTQPTPITVQESVVKDAAYTTWALWRWANGEIVPKLRGLTEAACKPADLKRFLRSEDRRHVDFALRYILEHHGEDLQYQEDVVYVLEHGDREQVELAMEYLTGAIRDERKLHACLIGSCVKMRSNYNRIVLDYFAEQPDLPSATLEGLTGCLAQLPYFQVHLILRILESQGYRSAKTTADVAALLDSDDFFIARRASEYLRQQKELDAKTKEKLAAFLNRSKDRL